MSLTEFLSAQIAEDEAVAKAAEFEWRSAALAERAALGVAYHVVQPATAAHPARVLAECEAKRRIVAVHESSEDTRGVGQHRDGKWTPYCEHDGENWPCVTVRAIAAVYADHPDYRDEWKP